MRQRALLCVLTPARRFIIAVCRYFYRVGLVNGSWSQVYSVRTRTGPLVYAVYGESALRQTTSIYNCLICCLFRLELKHATRTGDFGMSNDVSLNQLRKEVAANAFDAVIHVGGWFFWMTPMATSLGPDTAHRFRLQP